MELFDSAEHYNQVRQERKRAAERHCQIFSLVYDENTREFKGDLFPELRTTFIPAE